MSDLQKTFEAAEAALARQVVDAASRFLSDNQQLDDSFLRAGSVTDFIRQNTTKGGADGGSAESDSAPSDSPSEPGSTNVAGNADEAVVGLQDSRPRPVD